jgi:hypothetical protein
MKKVLMAVITCMIMLPNVFANDAKSVGTPESKNEICIVIDKAILRKDYAEDIYGKRTWEPDQWIIDFRIVADYYHYITKNNRLGLGLGISINPYYQFLDTYGVVKLKVPLTNRWFLGAGAGLGNVDITEGHTINKHEFFKLFTGFDFKNISIYLSYTQDILYGSYKRNSWISKYKAINLGIGTRFTI